MSPGTVTKGKDITVIGRPIYTVLKILNQRLNGYVIENRL